MNAVIIIVALIVAIVATIISIGIVKTYRSVKGGNTTTCGSPDNIDYEDEDEDENESSAQYE
jgi:hypothetical protein